MTKRRAVSALYAFCRLTDDIVDQPGPNAADTLAAWRKQILAFPTARDSMEYSHHFTNILRDVGEDWRVGRVYLPQTELAAFGLSEEDLALGRVNDRWRAFMRFQIDRNRRLYRAAWLGIAQSRWSIGNWSSRSVL